MNKGASVPDQATHASHGAAKASPPSGECPSRGERTYRSLYEPATGRIACVLMQAVYRLDREPCHFFGAGDWNTGLPHKSAAPFIATESEWRWLGSLTREERVSRFAALASAGEAGTATTPQSGVVHEHATAKGGDAQ